MQLIPLPQSLRPRDVLVHSDSRQTRVAIALQLPEGQWLAAETIMAPVWPWHSGTFLVTFAGMSAVAALLTLWAVRRLIRPVGTLAAITDTSSEVSEPRHAAAGKPRSARAPATATATARSSNDDNGGSPGRARTGRASR